ncbi:putative ribonuclease H-like domain-containing protein [Tanacetum coccineum]
MRMSSVDGSSYRWIRGQIVYNWIRRRIAGFRSWPMRDWVLLWPIINRLGPKARVIMWPKPRGLVHPIYVIKSPQSSMILPADHVLRAVINARLSATLFPPGVIYFYAVFPISVPLYTGGALEKDPAPHLTARQKQTVQVLYANKAPFRRYPGCFLVLVGLSLYYPFDENTYPAFERPDKTDMGLLDYIRTADPRKVQAVEVQKGEEQVKLLDSIKHCFVSLDAPTVKVWKLCPLPKGKISIGTKWILKNKRDARGIVVRNKARLVAQGHRKEEGIDYDEAWCDEFEVLMKGEFEMSAMGELTFFLGLQVKQKPDGIFISQDKSMIGSLMYLTASRPDIMFAVSACSRHQVTPLTSNLNAVKKIFKYLKGQPKLGLWYPRDSPFVLEAYSDSDYAGSNGDRKSTTGGCQFLGRRLISWQCKKQTVVATSSTEAEYVAAAHCCGQSTICIVKNPVFHQRTKHIEIRHHFIRDANEKNLIQVLKIHTDDNVADLLTKAFDGPRFNYLVVHIGMLNP